MKLNKITWIISMTLISSFSDPVISDEFMYTDYINAMENDGVVPDDVLIDTNVPPNRIINLLIRQNEMVENEGIREYIRQLDLVLTLPSMIDFEQEIVDLKLQALMKSGQYIIALRELDKHEPNSYYDMLRILIFLELGNTSEALLEFNDIFAVDSDAPEFGEEEEVSSIQSNEDVEGDSDLTNQSDLQDKFISLAKDMIVRYSVGRDEFVLNDEQQLALSESLGKYYEEHQLFYSQFLEGERKGNWLKSDVEIINNSLDLIDFSNTHGFVSGQISVMETFLLNLNDETVFDVDPAVVNEISNHIVEYYVDERNLSGKNEIQLYKYIYGQSLIADENINNKILYLKNKYLIQRYVGDEGLVSTSIELALLNQSKSDLVLAYKPDLASENKIKILDAYFSLEEEYVDDLYMAIEYAPFVSLCESESESESESEFNYPEIVILMKAHNLANLEQDRDAYKCYQKVDMNEVDLEPELWSLLNDEKIQLQFEYDKSQGDFSSMMAIAKEKRDPNMVYDSAIYIVENIDDAMEMFELIGELFSLAVLTDVYKDNVEDLSVQKAQELGDTNALRLHMEKSKDKYLLDLAWLESEDDNISKAIDYLIEYLDRGLELDRYNQVRMVRYLDSNKRYLDYSQIRTLKNIGLNNPSISRMIELHDIENVISDTFSRPVDGDDIEVIQARLAQYEKFDLELNENNTEANYAAELYIKLRLNIYLEEELIRISQRTESEQIKQFLNDQVESITQIIEQYYIGVFNEKIDGIFDSRIFLALQDYVNRLNYDAI